MPDKNPKRAAAEPGEATDETFFERWSRLKVSGESPEAGAEAGTSAAAPAPAPEEPHEAAPVLTDADMPDLDTIDQNSDVSGFLSAGVSEGLRRKALRKLFTGAKFNIRDGLDDYDDDFRSFTPLGGIVTADMRHHVERRIQAAKAAAEKRLASLGDEAGGAADADAIAEAASAQDPASPTAGEEDSRGENDNDEDSRNV